MRIVASYLANGGESGHFPTGAGMLGGDLRGFNCRLDRFGRDDAQLGGG